MLVTKLQTALSSVNWANNVNALLSDAGASQRLADCNMRLAIWARQFENTDKGNPALAFIREMQIAGQSVTVLVALSLYKSAASSIRTVLETGLYYSYFRDHPAELATLARGGGYFVEKREIIDFHKRHTPDFSSIQQKLGVVSRIDNWYSAISAIVHGQIPGTWVDYKGVADIAPIKSTEGAVIDFFGRGEDAVHRLFLCTVGRQLWHGFSSQAKAKLLSGLTGEEKKYWR
jgi:hypothetical protein